MLSGNIRSVTIQILPPQHKWLVEHYAYGQIVLQKQTFEDYFFFPLLYLGSDSTNTDKTSIKKNDTPKP